MSTCRKHPHSTAISARICWIKQAERRGERAYRHLPIAGPYVQAEFKPPREEDIGNGIIITRFFGGQRCDTR